MSSRPPASALVDTPVQPIRWADMDALGHLNDTVYFRSAGSFYEIRKVTR